MPPSPLRPTAVDATLIRALPSMVWALWRDDEHRAAKLHLQFDLLKGAPEKPRVTHAQASETDAMRAGLEPGRLYITDRGYFDFSLMADILRAKSSFVARVRNNIVAETLEERPIGEEARRQGIEADAAEFEAAYRAIATAVAERAALAAPPEIRCAGREVHVITDGLAEIGDSLPALSRRRRVSGMEALREHFEVGSPEPVETE